MTGTLGMPGKKSADMTYKPAAYDLKINRDGNGMIQTVSMTPKQG